MSDTTADHIARLAPFGADDVVDTELAEYLRGTGIVAEQPEDNNPEQLAGTPVLESEPADASDYIVAELGKEDA